MRTRKEKMASSRIVCIHCAYAGLVYGLEKVDEQSKMRGGYCNESREYRISEDEMKIMKREH